MVDVPATTTVRCGARLSSDDSTMYLVQGELNIPPEQRGIGFVSECRPAGGPSGSAWCPDWAFRDGFEFVRITDGGPGQNVPSAASVCSFGLKRSVCRRNWQKVMTDLRKVQCCSGQNTSAYDCEQHHCYGTSVCNSVLTSHCSKPENVGLAGCTRFCRDNPAQCRLAVQQKCRGNELKTEFCRTQCKSVDCTAALRDFAARPENKNDPLVACFTDDDFKAFEAKIKQIHPFATVYRHCAFPKCSTNIESKLLLQAGAPQQRLSRCPEQCMQLIEADLNDGVFDEVELINKCVLDIKEDDNKDGGNGGGGDGGGRIPRETLAERLLREAEEAAARKRRRTIVVWSSIAFGILLFIIVLFLVIRSRRKRKAVATTGT